MGKDRLYFLTFISILIVFLVFGIIGVNLAVKISINLLAEGEFASSKKEVQKIAYILSNEFKDADDTQGLIKNFQNVLYDTESEVTYLTILDKENKIICHPKTNQLGKEALISTKLEKSINLSLKLNGVQSILEEYKKNEGTKGENDELELLYQKRIKNTDLRVASVIRLDKFSLIDVKLKRRLHSIFIFMGAFITVLSFFTVRLIGSIYEKKIEAKNLDLENDIVNMAKLNFGVFMQQQKVANQENKEQQNQNVKVPNTDSLDNHKNRLLTYKGNELIPTFINEIAYIYTEDKITYVIDKSGKRTVSKVSLDEIFTQLDTVTFFRATRQFIININCIEKIIKYGNSQLKILIFNSDAEVVISKNRVAEFKKWLNI